MRRELRQLALICAVGSGTMAVVLGAVMCWVLLRIERDLLTAGEGRIPWWGLALALLLLAGGGVGIPLFAAMALAERRAPRLVNPMRQLAQHADQFVAGGFAGGLSELGPNAQVHGPPSGVEEVDAVSRVLDRNHRYMVRALRSERSFAADASHQLRTPLSAMLMRLEEITTADTLKEARAEAEIAITQTERLAGVVDELLHRTREGHADGGRSVSLDTVLSQLQQGWEPTANQAGRELSITTERGMIVRSSGSAIASILGTLIENSLIHGQGTVSLRAYRSGPSAVIEARDEGPGVSAQLGRRIFERAVTTGSGTGLGLAVARETAESVGGRLELLQAQPAVFALYVSMAPAR